MRKFTGIQFAFHYLTNEPGKIIGHVERRETKAVKDYHDDQEWNTRLNHLIIEKGGQPIQHSNLTIDDVLEQIVVRVWDGVVSIYSTLTHDYTFHKYLSWMVFDDRKKSAAQKFAALIIGRIDDKFEVALYRNGSQLITRQHIDSDVTPFEMTLKNLDDGELLSGWLQSIPLGNSEDQLISFNLFLPNNWSEKWSVFKRTQFVTFCS